LKRKGEEKVLRFRNLLPKMRMMKAQKMLKKILTKMMMTASTAVMLRTVLTTRNPLRRLTSPAEMFQKLAP
jgi:hypothetical protein